MKHITLFLLLITLFSSCEDRLDEVPKNFVSRTNYYTNEADAEGAIAGTYASLDGDYYGITYYLFEELHGDYLEGRGSQAPITVFDQILDPNNIGRAGTNWSNLYKGINRANAVIANVANIEDINETVKKRIIAEAHFLRASAYFNLVRFWGPVPLRLNESTNLSELAAPKESEANVYVQILEDALKAEIDLPQLVGSETGRASKWAAKMLLAQVYLTLEDWGKCAEKSLEVINSGQFSLVQVTQPSDFYQIFGVETSTEDIMSVHHSETRQSTIPLYLHRGNTFPYNYSGTGYFAWLPITESFIGDSWDDNDLRKDFNLYTEHLNAAGEIVPLPESSPILFKKFITDPDGLRVYSVPIYRYAEAFLMYAEAACMDEGSPSAAALEKLNIIKRRAYGYDLNAISPIDYETGLGKEEFRKIVIQERAYEFLLERKRWWDLKRTGTVEEAFAKIGKTFINDRYLWPIPENEINNNPALTQADQNPGY